MNEGGILAVTGGALLEVDATEIDINPGGVLFGNGDVQFDSLSNTGLISAIAGPSEQLALLSGTIDLDGAGGGQVLATLGDLRLSGTPTDAFDGQMTIGAGREIQMFGIGWEIGQSSGSDAEILLDGGDILNPASLTRQVSSLTFAHGTLNVEGYGDLNGVMVFEDGFETHIAAGAVLRTDSVRYRGGTHHGAGMLYWNGSVLVEQDTVIHVQHTNMDGDGGNAITLGDASLTINSQSIDATNRFNGELTLNGPNADLVVNLPLGDSWTQDGTLVVSGGGGAQHPTVGGSPFELSGSMDVSGVVGILAPVDVSGSIVTSLGTDQVLLEGPGHVIRNTAHVGGPGELHVRAGARLNAEDGATIVADLINLGRFEPGLSTGSVVAGSDFLQTSSGTFAVEIEGAPFFNQDEFDVTETAFLAGELEVTVLDGEMPSLGLSYTVLTANNVSGTFDTLTVLSENPVFTYTATVQTTSSRAVVRFNDVTMLGDFDDDLTLGCADVDALVAEIASGGVDLAFDLTGDGMIDTVDLEAWLSVAGTHNVGGPYLLGDANLDGVVDGADFVIWNGNKFTSHPSWCAGDFTADGVIDGADFIAWNTNKFMMSEQVAAAVPEATFGMPAFALLVIVARMRSNRLSARAAT